MQFAEKFGEPEDEAKREREKEQTFDRNGNRNGKSNSPPVDGCIVSQGKAGRVEKTDIHQSVNISYTA